MGSSTRQPAGACRNLGSTPPTNPLERRAWEVPWLPDVWRVNWVAGAHAASCRHGSIVSPGETSWCWCSVRVWSWLVLGCMCILALAGRWKTTLRFVKDRKLASGPSFEILKFQVEVTSRRMGSTSTCKSSQWNETDNTNTKKE